MPASTQLQEVRSCNITENTWPEGIVTLVLVPSPCSGHLPTSRWEVAKAGSSLTAGIPHRIFRFVYQNPIISTAACDSFPEQASKLAQEIKQLYDDGRCPGPIVFAAHSLAGLLVQQCLVLARNKQQYGIIFKKYAGSIFMGCILSDRERDLAKQQFLAILHTDQQHHLSKKAAHAMRSRLDGIIGIITEFDKLALRGSSVSIYEESPTAPKRRLFHNNRPQKLVEKSLASPSSNQDNLIGVAPDHANLPCLLDDQGRPDRQCMEKIRRLLENAPGASRPPTVRSGGRMRSSSLDANAGVTRQRRLSLVRLQPLIEEFHMKPCPDAQKFPFFAITISRQPSRPFCGREGALQSIENLLLSSRGLAAIRANSGSGKTELALQFAHMARENDLFDCICWLRADSTPKVREDFGAIATKLDLVSNSTSSMTDAREVAKTWLLNPIVGRGSGRNSVGRARCLLILDGADDLSCLTEFEWLRGKVSILVTSRDPAIVRWVNWAPAALMHADMPNACIELQPIVENAALQILTELSETTLHLPAAEYTAAQDLVRALGLGGRPLDLIRMAGIVKSGKQTFVDLREYYLYSKIREEQVPVISAMELSNLQPAERELLAVFSLFDSDRIQEDLFIGPASEQGYQELRYLNTSNYRSSKAALVQANLVMASGFRGNEPDTSPWMHAAVQENVLNELDTDLLEQAFKAAVWFLAAQWKPPPRREHIREWEDCKAYRPHVQRVRQAFERITPALDDGTDPAVYRTLVTLLCDSADLDREHGNTAGTKAMLDVAKTISDRLPPSESLELQSKVYHLLGAWANETNRKDLCLDYSLKYLNIRVGALQNGARPDIRTAMAYNEIGIAYMMREEIHTARTYFTQSMETYQALPGYQPGIDDALPTVNKACAEWLLQNYRDAERLLTDGMYRREDKLGILDRDSFHTGRFLHILGNVYYSQERYTASETLHRRALRQYQSTIGKSHHRTADVCYRIAHHLMRPNRSETTADDLKYAELLIDQALSSYYMDETSFLPEIARTTFLQARLNNDRSSSLRQKAIDLRRELLPDDRIPEDQLTEEHFDSLVTFWSR